MPPPLVVRIEYTERLRYGRSVEQTERVVYTELMGNDGVYDFERTWAELNADDWTKIYRLVWSMRDELCEWDDDRIDSIEVVRLFTFPDDAPETWVRQDVYVKTYPNGCPVAFDGLVPFEEVKRRVRAAT